MGLAAAYQLALDGYCPVVFEADDRIGGTSASFDFNGLKIERFYHYYCTPDNDLLRIIDELGLTAKLHWVETKMSYWLDEKLQLWGNPFALLRFKGLTLLEKTRYGLHVFLSTMRNDWQSLDNKVASRWLIDWIGKGAYEKMWRTLLEYKFHEYSHEISAAWFWSRIRRMGRSRYSIFREKLGYLEGGSETLLQGMKNVIEAKGGEIRLNSSVSKVILEDGEVKGVIAAGKMEKFDQVISTIPLPVIPQIISDLSQDVLDKYRDIPYIAVICVIVRLRKALTNNFWLNINDDHMVIPGLVEFSNIRPLGQHIVYVPYYLPSTNPLYSWTDEQFQKQVKQYFQIINPSLQDEDFLDFHVNRYANAQAICRPGYMSKIPPLSPGVKGLWIADTSYYYPEDRGTSESIGLGRRIARQVSKSV